MDDKLRKVLRCLFKLLMYESDGKNFQSIFEEIMKKKYGENFIKIKPYGNIGDKKNDGYLISDKVYYQVYGPENIENSINYAIEKLHDDINGLFSQWSDAKKIVYVVNDKYYGTKPQVATLINNLDSEVKKIDGKLNVDVRLWGCSELEEIFLELSDDNREDILETPYYDDVTIDLIDFHELREVVNYIINLPVDMEEENLFPPDYEQKIEANGFSNKIAQRLEKAHLNADKIEEFFNNSNVTLADDLRARIIFQYKKAKGKIRRNDPTAPKDEVYVELINMLCKERRKACLEATEALIAYYFESCDIFDPPLSSTKVGV